MLQMTGLLLTGEKSFALDYYFQEHLSKVGITYFSHCLKRQDQWSAYFSNKKWGELYRAENMINHCPIIDHHKQTGLNLISHKAFFNARQLIAGDEHLKSISQCFEYNDINQAMSLFHDFGLGTEVLCLGWKGKISDQENIFDIIFKTLNICKRLHT